MGDLMAQSLVLSVWECTALPTSSSQSFAGNPPLLFQKILVTRISCIAHLNHPFPSHPLMPLKTVRSALPGLHGLQAVFGELKELTGTKERALAALSADGDSQYSKVRPVLNTSAGSVSIRNCCCANSPSPACNDWSSILSYRIHSSDIRS